jgi:hypothetical protein
MRCVALLLCLVLPLLAHGQRVYRSVDAEGNVSFSDQPPADGSTATTMDIELPPGPGSAQRERALRRNEELRTAEQRSDQRRRREQAVRDQALQQAQRELDNAKIALQQAKIHRDSDWQGKAGGGRRLRPEYFERVKRAEQMLEAAQQQVNRIRAGQL